MKRSALVIVSGIPGSGKTFLGRRLASALNMPALDKDDFLDRLITAESAMTPARRRALSRKSDELFEDAARSEFSAVLISFWNVPGMPADSGTPTAWLMEAAHSVVGVHCACPPEIAAQRFVDRARHPGHGDAERTLAELVDEFGRLASLGAPALPRRVRVETDRQVDVDDLARTIRSIIEGTS